jgi:CubicO group peptidase (beta-lactamase class C family)
MWQYLATRKHDSAVTHQAEYSNLGFGLLGELLAVSQGTSYEALIQRDIAKPLGMRDTGVALAPEAMARMAIGHDSKLAKTPYWDLPAMAGAGALKSSLRDMTVFMRALQSGALPGARLATRAQVGFGEDGDVGLGWIRSQREGETLVWHNGGTGGFRSFSGYSEQSGLAVVVLSNAAISVDDLGMHLLDPRTPLAAKAKEEAGTGPIWITVLITLCVWIATVLMPWRLRFKGQADALPSDDAPPSAEQSRKSRIREALARAIKPRFVTSRADSLWVALEIALVAALLGAFGPWGFLGMWAKWGIVTSILLGGVLVPIRARRLPWSDSAPISSGKLLSRAFTGILVIGVLALWLA